MSVLCREGAEIADFSRIFSGMLDDLHRRKRSLHGVQLRISEDADVCAKFESCRRLDRN
ncbi:MAG: hypothetical protein KZQ76_07400 [Candidatus Thiodiazotropha sp. (ex Epidulcina cf. delphinae)]|nr:hypothetical protein [Candidatus Thiodiazotropha sp. (ex Epidulcina cf. delphinae)]